MIYSGTKSSTHDETERDGESEMRARDAYFGASISITAKYRACACVKLIRGKLIATENTTTTTTS